MKIRHLSPSPEIPGFSLADGSRWSIRGSDSDTSSIADLLKDVMQMAPMPCSGCRLIRLITYGNFSSQNTVPVTDTAAACVPRPTPNGIRLAILVSEIADIVSRDDHGAFRVLLHGALVERRGLGVILAGRGQVGKTTASRRLPPPWSSRCDDTTLVVRDRHGLYWAHPWPTGSALIRGVGDARWDVQRAVPLGHIFFLIQGERDGVEPVGEGEAVGRLVESAEQVSRVSFFVPDKSDVRQRRSERFENVCVLARSVPTHRLRLTRDGRFWEKIEPILDGHGETSTEWRG